MVNTDQQHAIDATVRPKGLSPGYYAIVSSFS